MFLLVLLWVSTSFLAVGVLAAIRLATQPPYVPLNERFCPWHSGPDDPPWSTCVTCDVSMEIDLDYLDPMWQDDPRW